MESFAVSKDPMYFYRLLTTINAVLCVGEFDFKAAILAITLQDAQTQRLKGLSQDEFLFVYLFQTLQTK